MPPARPRPTARHRLGRLALLGAAAPVLVLGAGCSKKDDGASAKDCRAITGGRTTLVGKNVAWNTNCLTLARPGKVDVTVDNEDKGVAHNLRVVGNGVNQKTPLQTGPRTQHLAVVLPKAGTYQFVCDIHATMEGQLRVG